MKRALILLSAILLLSAACKMKKKGAGNFFPVLSFIKSQIAHVDTSLYNITKIIYMDTIHADTTYVRREEFRGLAKDFLSIPDLTEKKYQDRYREEKMFDETLNRVILTYKPENQDKEELQDQEVLITPDLSGDKVNSIIIDQVISNKDGFLQKRMLWQVDQSFQVTTIAQKPGEPETITTMKVTWNEKEEK